MTRLARVLAPLVVTVALFGTAHAQSWFGLRTGYPLGLTLHVGVEDAIADVVDLRLSGRFESVGGNARVGVAVDFLQTVSPGLPAMIYVGGGPAISVGSGATYLDLHALVGAEYRLVDVDLTALGLFAELSVGAEIDASGGGRSRFPAVGAALGFNWHF